MCIEASTLPPGMSTFKPPKVNEILNGSDANTGISKQIHLLLCIHNPRDVNRSERHKFTNQILRVERPNEIASEEEEDASADTIKNIDSHTDRVVLRH
jgi:hypothetical protein